MTQRTRVKICGITDPQSAEAVISAGADAMGMVFYPASPRHLSLENARDIAAVAHPFVSLVGLFVDASREDIDRVLEHVPLQLIQFHGNETPEFCEAVGLPYGKALRVQSHAGLREKMNEYQQAQAILLDTYKKGVPGGTGETFDWALVPESSQKIILAGGLHPENIGRAIHQVKPYAVDTSGGVESAPGVKDTDRIRAFTKQVASADKQIYG